MLTLASLSAYFSVNAFKIYHIKRCGKAYNPKMVKIGFCEKICAKTGGVYKVNDRLFERRKYMLSLSAGRNKPQAICRAVASRFDIPYETARRDYYNMKNWVHEVQQDSLAVTVISEGMDFAVRQAYDIYLSIQPVREGAGFTPKQQFLRLQALHAYIKATVEDYKFRQSIGQITRKPEEIISHEVPMSLPFECDPEIKRILLERAEEQRQQKALREQQRAKDAAEGSEAKP
jgi:hypothetical protein